MVRRSIVIWLVSAGLLLRFTPVLDVLTSPASGQPDVWTAIGAALGVLIAGAIPILALVLLARGRETGVALMVGAALAAIPSLTLVPGLTISSPDERMAWELLPYLGDLLLVVAGIVAWTLRDRVAWRWDRPVPSPYLVVALAAVIGGQVLPALAPRSTEGVLVATGAPIWVTSSLLVTTLGLVGVARWRHPISGAFLLALMLPRVLDLGLDLLAGAEIIEPPWPTLILIGLAAQVTLVLVAVWWVAPGPGGRLEPASRLPDSSLSVRGYPAARSADAPVAADEPVADPAEDDEPAAEGEPPTT